MRKVSIKLVPLLIIISISWCLCVLIGINTERSMCDNLYILSFQEDDLYFTENDISALEQEGVCLSYAAYLYPEVSSGFREQDVTVIATNENFPYFTGLDVQEGAFFNVIQEERELQVAVLSKTAAYDLFGNDNCIGETVFINQASYKVIGIVDEKNTNKTAKIYIPYQTVSALKTGDTMCNQIWCSFSNMAEASLMMGKAGFSLEDLEIQQMNLYRKVFCLRFYFPLVMAGVCIVLAFSRKIKIDFETRDKNFQPFLQWRVKQFLRIAQCGIALIVTILLIRRSWCVPPYSSLAGESGMELVYAVLDFYVMEGMNINEMIYLKHWNLLSLLSFVICLMGMLMITAIWRMSNNEEMNIK
jgi:hypothetical protein